MPRLSFAKREYAYRVGSDGVAQTYAQMEYLVDDVDLSTLLGIHDLGILAKLTRLSPRELGSYRALELRGLTQPDNQFGSNRLVLYGCHCGCDYCGVISCMARREGDDLIWSDIRGEDFCETITPVAELIFSATQVDRAIESLPNLQDVRPGKGAGL